MADSGEGDALDRADAAADLAFSDPARARRIARQVIESAGRNTAAGSVARQAIGLVQIATGDLKGAEGTLRQAISVARDPQLRPYAAQARGVLGYVLTLAGRTGAALREMDLALSDATGIAAARLRMQRALVFTELSRFDDALDEFGAALRALRDAGGDDLIEATIRNNRSILLARRGRWRAAEADLQRAEDIFAAGEHAGRTAMVYQNRGLAATVHGDIPAALAAFDESARRYAAAGTDPGLLPIERAEALLSVRLLSEARDAAAAAVRTYTDRGNAVDLVQARLLAARVALAGGDPAAAADLAGLARRDAVRQRRPGWAALADHLRLRARWAAGDHTRAAVRAGRRTVDRLAATGWVAVTADARLTVARTALAAGDRKAALAELAATAAARRRGVALVRSQAWYATALLRLDRGERPAADSALRAGVVVLQSFSAGLGAPELRAAAAGHAAELTALGVRLAIEDGRAERVFRWSERGRGWALRLPPARPPGDEQLAVELARLRQVVTDVAAAVGRGDDPARLLAEQQRLERAIRDRARRSAGTDPTADPPPRAADVLERLDGAAMVQYVAVDDELWAVTLAARARLHRLGPVAGIRRGLEDLGFLTRRLSYGPSPVLARRLGELLDALDEALIRPLVPEIGDRAVVLVPTTPLHHVPWSRLPACRGRPVSVSPSATLWLRAARAAPADERGRRVLIAGPDLDHAEAEVADIAALHPHARMLTGPRATAQRVMDEVDGAELVHLAAHGHFRSDNPDFSALRLADGLLTVHDLQRLRRPPRTLVLSACDSARSAVHAGDELLGLSATMLAMGTACLVGAVSPVPDDASREVMVDFHRRLAGGLRPAAALAQAQQAHQGTANPAAALAAAEFVCFGTG